MTIARRIRAVAASALLATALATTLTGAAAQDRDCGDFDSQEDAQAAFDAAGAGDPLRLDDDGDGIACETLPARPATGTTPSFGDDLYEVGREIAPGRYRTSGGTGDCYWARLSSDTGASGAVIEFDVVSGEASFTILSTDAFVEFEGDCRWTFVEALPSPSVSPSPTITPSPSVTPTPTPAPRPSPTAAPAVDDRDCADFATQALAQAALAADRTDPDNLDADDDGVACEERFGTDGQQVSVLPLGGVATGGLPTP